MKKSFRNLLKILSFENLLAYSITVKVMLFWGAAWYKVKDIGLGSPGAPIGLQKAKKP
jgi:hypothetical protein